MPPGVDETQLFENLKLTPTERLEKMLAFQRELEEMRDEIVRQRTGGR